MLRHLAPGNKPFAPVTTHFKSARKLIHYTGTKFGLTCVEKVLGSGHVPIRPMPHSHLYPHGASGNSNYCSLRVRIGTAMYRQGVYEEEI